MAFFDTTWYCNFGNGTSTAYYAVPQHAASTAYTAGQIVRQFTTPAVGNERCFVCIVAGTSAAATDATWVLTRGAKTTDGTVTWIECTGATSMNGDQANTQSWAQVKAIGSAVTIGQIIKRNSGASYQVCTLSSGNTGATEPAFSDTPGATTVDGSATWTCLGLVGSFSNGGAPHARLASVFVGGWFASGNTVYVGDNHAETQGSGSVTWNPSSAALARILCHNHSGAYPPAASDMTVGASVTTTSSATQISFTGLGSYYFYGLTFISASTSVGGAIFVGGNTISQVQNWYCFDNCSFQQTAGTGLGFQFGAQSTAWGIVILNNCTMKFASANACVFPYFAQIVWQNTGPVLVSGSVIPTTLFQLVNSTGRFNNITLTNLDLSQLTGSLFTNAANSSIGTLLVQDCKLNAAMTVTQPINSGMRVEYLRSDSAGTSYKSQRITYEAIETTETTIVRTGGAVDPSGQAQSRKIVTSATAEWLRPYKAEPLAIWNSTTGSPVTVTVCGTVQASTLPYTDELWMEVEYLADASSMLGTIVSTTKSNLLAGGSPVALDSSVWFVPPVTYVTWDPATVTAVTLSGGNLVATNTGTTSADQGAKVVSTSGKTSGKYYFEVTYTSGSNPGTSNMSVGIGTIASTYTGMGNNATSGSVCYLSGTIYHNGAASGVSVGAIVVVGNIIGVAVDLDSHLVWFRLAPSGNWNSSSSNNPTTGVGGVTIPTGTMVPFCTFGGSGGVASNVWTVNFGASAFSGAVPSGFTAGWTA